MESIKHIRSANTSRGLPAAGIGQPHESVISVCAVEHVRNEKKKWKWCFHINFMNHNLNNWKETLVLLCLWLWCGCVVHVSQNYIKGLNENKLYVHSGHIFTRGCCKSLTSSQTTQEIWSQLVHLWLYLYNLECPFTLYPLIMIIYHLSPTLGWLFSLPPAPPPSVQQREQQIHENS